MTEKNSYAKKFTGSACGKSLPGENGPNSNLLSFHLTFLPALNDDEQRSLKALLAARFEEIHKVKHHSTSISKEMKIVFSFAAASLSQVTAVFDTICLEIYEQKSGHSVPIEVKTTPRYQRVKYGALAAN